MTLGVWCNSAFKGDSGVFCDISSVSGAVSDVTLEFFLT